MILGPGGRTLGTDPCPDMRRLVALSLALAVTPAAQPAWLDAGVDSLRAGDAGAAAATFGAALRDAPGDRRAHALLAVAQAADDRARSRALDRALREVPDHAGLIEVGLSHLRDHLGEARALSMADSRRERLARRLLDLDPASALAHEELALRSFLDYRWRRRNAERRGLWTPDAPDRATRAALAARDDARASLDAALLADPASPGAHRLRMRIAAVDGDADALTEAARATRRSRPADPWADLYGGLAAARSDDVAEAATACRLGAERLPAPERAAFLSARRLARPSDRGNAEADSAGWDARFWAARDPRLLTPENERWVEHCARLVAADLLFGADGTRGWDTPRGDTYVRYGPPDAETWWLAQGDGRYHRWVYADFAVTFHDWVSSGAYQPASSAFGEDDATRLRSRNNTVGESGETDLARPTFGVPVLASAFRTADGGTEWVVAYGVPVDRDGETTPVREGEALRLQTGVFLQRPDGRVADARRRTVRRAASASVIPYAAGAVWTDATTLRAVPEAALVVEVAQPWTGAFGRNRVRLPARSFRGGGLHVSDLLLAYHLGVDRDGPVPDGHVRRGDVVLHPAPWGVASTAEPLVLYAEVYGLRVRDGATAFEVDAVLDPVDEAGPLGRLARRVAGRRLPPAVSAASTERGDASDDAVALSLDLRDQPPGTYTLTLTIRDLAARSSASASRTVRLESPAP